MRRGALIRIAAVLLGWAVASTAVADARTDFLVRMLTSSTQFRVRVQAALALGAQRADGTILSALSKGLKDEHPSVRSASATALGKLKDASAAGALKAAQRDSDAGVRRAAQTALAALSGSSGRRTSGSSGRAPPAREPTGPPAFYVGVGMPGDKVGIAATELGRLRGHVVRSVSSMDGVVVAPEHESESAANGVLRSRKLAGFFVDSAVTKVEVRPDGAVRAEVSVIVGTYPGRDIKAMLSGAATVPAGGASAAARERAIQGAFTGALRRLPQAMRAAAPR